MEFVNGQDDLGNHLLFVFLFGKQRDAYQSFIWLVVRNLLLHFGIGVTQLRCLFWIDLLFMLILNVLCGSEEAVVEFYDSAGGTEVDVEVFHFNLFFVEEVLDTIEQTPVTASPAIYALFDITHDEIGAAAHGLIEQDAEILPLNGTGVLELIYHDVFQLRAQFLKDERRVGAVHQVMEECLCVTEQEAVCLLVERTHPFFYIT